MKIASRFARRRPEFGFTLIELMVVVAIVAILSAIAIPSYRSYILRTHRKEAMAALQGLAQAMERYHVQNGTYINADVAHVPNIFFTTAPMDGGTPLYNLRITDSDANSYVLQAQPIDGAGQADDGFIQLRNTGVRSWDKDNSGDIAATENTWNDR